MTAQQAQIILRGGSSSSDGPSVVAVGFVCGLASTKHAAIFVKEIRDLLFHVRYWRGTGREDARRTALLKFSQHLLIYWRSVVYAEA